MIEAPLALAALLALLLVPAASAQLANPPVPAAPNASATEELQSAEVLAGEEVPSYFVVSAFLRRAALVLDRPAEQRPEFFATFGCGPGSPTFEKCAQLIREAAAVHTRKTEAETPAAKQAALDAKGHEIGKIYAQLLQLIAKSPEQAGAFHRKVEEVRITVGVALSEEPGQDLLQAARAFDQDFKASYPQAASLPGFVPARPE